jgi:hypothetical protein
VYYLTFLNVVTDESTAKAVNEEVKCHGFHVMEIGVEDVNKRKLGFPCPTTTERHLCP